MTVRSMVSLIASAITLASCASPSAHVARPYMRSDGPPVRSMTYATTACHGFCPVYNIRIEAGGSGVFEGVSHTAVHGRRPFTATIGEAADFFSRLRPYLPVGEVLLTGPDGCRSFATDLPSVEVTWEGEGGGGRLRYNYGCDRDRHADLADALRRAPEALPIAELIGRVEGTDDGAGSAKPGYMPRAR